MLAILHSTPRANKLVHLAKLARAFGVLTEFIDVTGAKSPVDALRKAAAREIGAIVLDIDSLAKSRDERWVEQLGEFLAVQSVPVLLLIGKVDRRSADLVARLTSGDVRDFKRVESVRRANFPTSSATLTKELASYSYLIRAHESLELVLSQAQNVKTVMALDDSPTFVYIAHDKANLFVWVTDFIFEIDRPLSAEIEFEQALDQYIPAIVFFRFAFRTQCWHNPSPGAGLVIDDPLLQKRYGFIQFPQLLESARRHKYHVTLAFIPWNHWRSRAKEVQMFLGYSDCFSICAHGCDHTKNEFRSANYEDLLHKSFLASQRMHDHHRKTGLASQPLMVCPQEQYSLEAMRAFADSRQFLGLTCTACMPRDLPCAQLTGADLLLPAQDSFFGFPVFKRHYWSGMGAFAMALFLGKPAILVEHHEFFRDGSTGAEEFVRRLTELRPDLEWSSLVQTATTTHARRRVSEYTWEVRFFTDTFHLRIEQEKPTEYRLFRRIPEATRVQRVRVNGKEVPFSRENEFLRFNIQTRRPDTILVHVDVEPIRPAKAYSLGIKTQACVGLRRGLSELRDNVAARNRFALKAGSLLTKVLK